MGQHRMTSGSRANHYATTSTFPTVTFPGLSEGPSGGPSSSTSIAISGAAQHVLGISDAKAVCAINNDPDAQIFRHSHFGIVEDYRKVAPLLIERLRELTS